MPMLFPGFPGGLGQQGGGGGGESSLTDTHVGTWDAGANDTGTHSLGDAAADRIIVLAVGWVKSSAFNREITGITIGGVTATRAVRVHASENWNSEIFYAEVPTGATGNITVTFDGDAGTTRTLAFSVFRLVGYAVAPVDTFSSTSTNGSSPLSGKARFVASTCENTGPTITLTNITVTQDNVNSDGFFAVSTGGDDLESGDIGFSRDGSSGQLATAGAGWNLA